MILRRTTATLLGAGVTFACLTTGAAAHAAPAPHSTSNTAAGTAFSSTRTITPNTVTSTATIDGDHAIITLTGQAGQKITIHDSTGRAIAGTTLTTTTGTLTFTAPTSHQTYTVHADGTDIPTAAFSLRDDIVTPDSKPVVDDVDKQGARAIVDVTAAPRALVKVKNDSGKTLGLRMADNQGHTSIPVPVAKDDDTALKVSQTNAGQESAETDALSMVELESIEVEYTGLTYASVRVKALVGGQLVIKDDKGRTVWDHEMPGALKGDVAYVPVVDGTVTSYTATRTNFYGSSRPRQFDVSGQGDRAPLAAPTVSVLGGQYIQVKGVPGAAIHYILNDNFEGDGTAGPLGIFYIGVPTNGDTYDVTQSVGDETSPAQHLVVSKS